MPLSPSKSNSRLSSNIPLTEFTSSASDSRHYHDESTSFLGAHGQRLGLHHVDKPGSESDDTDSWVSTGDIGDQIDAEDPLRQRLNGSLDETALAGLKHLSRPNHKHSGSGSGGRKEKKHVRIYEDPEYQSHHSSRHAGVVNKEAIDIPEVILFHKPSRTQRLITSIMPGHSKGFTGKPLM